jgi:hypothetical protein
MMAPGNSIADRFCQRPAGSDRRTEYDEVGPFYCLCCRCVATVGKAEFRSDPQCFRTPGMAADRLCPAIGADGMGDR